MIHRAQIRIRILKVLRACQGIPMPEEAVIGAVVAMVVPEPGATDVRAELKDMENEGFTASHNDSITGRSHILTIAGELKAKQL